MPADPAIQVRNARKTFGARAALDDVSVTVARGEMIALIGPSGSGKSTLLRAMAGLVTLDAGAGAVDALGASVQRDGRIERAFSRQRARIGVVFQQFNLVGRLSLYTNAALGLLGRVGFWRGLLARWPAAEAQRVMQALVRVGVAEHAGQRAASLSGGQQQRGAIARALVQQAEVILADEPVASLDPVSAHRVMALLSALNASDGISVVVSLHQVGYALRHCPRIVALKDGKLVFDGPREALTRERLVDIYGPEIEAALPEALPT
jgi:phosphonate transport system ATP-binding protein